MAEYTIPKPYRDFYSNDMFAKLMDSVCITVDNSFPRINGETSDSNRIERAISSLPSAGGVLLFEAGINYTLSKPINIDKSNIMIFIPSGTVISSPTTIFSITSKENVHLFGYGKIQLTATSTGNDMIYISGSSNITIQGLLFDNNTNNPSITIIQSSHVYTLKNKFVGGSGIYASSSTHIFIGHNELTGKSGVNFTSVSYSDISHNYLHDIILSAIVISPNTNSTCLNIEHNHIDTCSADGINIYQNVSDGICINANTEIHINHNKISDCSQRGISVRVPKIHICHNTVCLSGKSGIYVSGLNNENSSIHIRSNWIYGNVTDTTTDTYSEGGIYISGSEAYQNPTYFIDGNSSHDNNGYQDRLYMMKANVKGIIAKLTSVTVNTTQTTISHGLTFTPKNIWITPNGNASVWKSGEMDSTNIYLTASQSTTVDVYLS